MLTYEHKRTEEIVERLIKTEKIVRFIMLISFALIFAPIGHFVARLFDITEAIPFGLFLGAAIGIFLGKYSMLLTSAIIEWMAQILVVQGDILHQLRKK
jgi:hypothetical protein